MLFPPTSATVKYHIIPLLWVSTAVLLTREHCSLKDFRNLFVCNYIINNEISYSWLWNLSHFDQEKQPWFPAQVKIFRWRVSSITSHIYLNIIFLRKQDPESTLLSIHEVGPFTCNSALLWDSQNTLSFKFHLSSINLSPKFCFHPFFPKCLIIFLNFF